MRGECHITWNIGGRLIEFERPLVMGIVNATPDSFYGHSRATTSGSAARMAMQMVAEGADIIDIGGCSTRPGSVSVAADIEAERLIAAVIEVRKAIGESALISVDTFRSDIARAAVEAGADMVNDVSGGADPDMFETVARLKVPYILTHSRDLSDVSGAAEYEGGTTADVIAELSSKGASLQLKGVADVVIDPGIGFNKTVAQNYELIRELSALQCLGSPLLVGISRKSMLWRPLGISADESLNATTALNMTALMNGASILRVHDVKAAVECVKIYQLTNSEA